MSPTQRAIAELKARGYLPWVVERWVPFPKPGHRQDAWNVLDIVACKPGEILGLQVTSTGVSSRVKKMLAAEATLTLIAAGMKLAVWGYAKKGKRGKRKVITLREVVITADSFGGKRDGRRQPTADGGA